MSFGDWLLFHAIRSGMMDARNDFKEHKERTENTPYIEESEEDFLEEAIKALQGE